MPRSADSRAVGWDNDLHDGRRSRGIANVDRMQLKIALPSGSPQKNNNPVN